MGTEPGTALTSPLQKRLQVLSQALLVVQHKFEDVCQLDLRQRSRGSAAALRQLWARGARAGAQPAPCWHRAVPGSGSPTRSSRQGSCCSWSCGTAAARPPATRHSISRGAGRHQPRVGLAPEPLSPPGHSSPFQTPRLGRGSRDSIRDRGTPLARRYLGQLQLFSLQELLCRHQVLRGRFVLAELCNTQWDPRSHRDPCHRVDTRGWVFPPQTQPSDHPRAGSVPFAAPPAAPAQPVVLRDGTRHLPTRHPCCGEDSPSWIWPARTSHPGFWAALRSWCWGRGHPGPWQRRGGGGCRAPRRRLLLCRKLRMKAARSGRGCSRTDCPSSVLWLQGERRRAVRALRRG